jgi:hypothetical protein
MIRATWNLFWILLAVITIHSCAIALVSPAHAEGYMLQCEHGRGNLSCFAGPMPSAEAKVIHVPADATDYGEERAREWNRVCRPRVVVDDLGVERLVYARPGCDVGAPR